MRTREVTRVRELLAGTDPISAAGGAFGDDEGQVTLARIVREPVPTGRWPMSTLRQRPGLRLGVAVAAIAVAATAVAVAAPAVLPGHRSGSAYAATPPLLHYTGSRQGARELLLTLAGAARRQPEPAAGRYDYVQTEGWYLDAAQDTNGHVLRSQVDPTRREQWTDAAGSGRVEETRRGIRTATSRYYGPGQLGGPPPLPTEPAALRAELARRTHGYGDFEWLVAVHDIWLAQVVPPRLQSELLQALAGLHGLSVKGSVTDRAGRGGVAVTTTSSGDPRENYAMIFNPQTGALLDYEQVTLDAGGFHVRPPATIDYTVWLRSGRVPSVEARP
ncbi:MAG: CU044_5270 family protein [Actinomycetota bacterium]|nr:CU044_5270 family protein [Actinomycetota bacterium]